MFAGIQPQVYAICKEYLELARMYSSPISSVRGHVFKLCRDALNVHTEFRPQFADCKDLDDFEDAIRRMEEKCSVCKATDRSPYNLHWTCKAYLRGDILLAEPEINCNLSALDENTSGDTTQHEMESCMLAVKHKRLQEEREKRKIEKRTRMAEKRKHTLRLGAQRHEFCTTCMMNKRPFLSVELVNNARSLSAIWMQRLIRLHYNKN
ncbi:unnamed protein product [Protopolystoma xenopodis]|uniref:Uncharacterized protein n=1 Tax=Protopolystoma xenopodis TaxID=117903 RepID=A0A448WCP8_9PLAT|nr:unnamed protein product [Protopolystoma xenopodis]